ncbi:MAG TPA: ABC transporter permease, partial [Actinobacteria bacterium]|nr:ABC transporter permease [Actinomycetes bacterium]HEX21541.1 ABC transporter permease [Actinomycetota bacterium]
MISYFKLVSANYKMTVRNVTSLFWLFVFPILMMSLIGIAFSGIGEQTVKIAIVQMDKSHTAAGITKSFSRIKAFKVTKTNKATALKRLKDGNVDAVLVMDKGFTAALERNLLNKNNSIKPAKIGLYYDPSSTFTSQAVRSAVANILTEINRRLSGAPVLISYTSHSVRSKGLRYIDFLVPGIIALTIMNSALFGLGGTVVSYRERGILRRLKVTPQPLSGFIAAQITNQLLFAILRAALLILVAMLLFDVVVVGSLVALAIVVIIGSLAFTTIAFFVASFAKTRETSDTLSNIISMPMMFLGGVFFPVDSVPKWIRPLVELMPLKYLGDAMRDVMVKGSSLWQVRMDIYILIGVTLYSFCS